MTGWTSRCPGSIPSRLLNSRLFIYLFFGIRVARGGPLHSHVLHVDANVNPGRDAADQIPLELFLRLCDFISASYNAQLTTQVIAYSTYESD